MDGLKVAELARWAGLPATTVRFYAREGLLPARRSSSGYRLYDEQALDRLAFITTAKNLGVPLLEVRRLLQPWQHGRCVDVQRELRPLLDSRLADARERVAELEHFVARLESARVELDAIERDGPCDPACSFLGHGSAPAMDTTPAPLRSASIEAPSARTPEIACSLSADARTSQVERWHTELAAVARRDAIAGGLRLTFAPGTSVTPLAQLAAAEAACCPFFDLRLHLGPPLALEVTATTDAIDLVHELFGSADT